MSRDDDLEIDELLAGARLAGSQYDEIQERVMAQVVPTRRSRWYPALGAAAALASFFGVWLFISTGEEVSTPPAPKGPAVFTAKGTEPGGSTRSPAPDVMFQLGCATQSGVCRLGDTLVFSVGGVSKSGFVGAYAVRAGEPSGERIWYFGGPSGAAPRLEPRAEPTVLREGVRLAPPHAPGRYEVTIWWSAVAPEPGAAGVPAQARLTRLALEIVE